MAAASGRDTYWIRVATDLKIVAAIAESAWRSKPSSGGFSLVEHVCHLRDIDGDGKIASGSLSPEYVPADGPAPPTFINRFRDIGAEVDPALTAGDDGWDEVYPLSSVLERLARMTSPSRTALTLPPVTEDAPAHPGVGP